MDVKLKVRWQHYLAEECFSQTDARLAEEILSQSELQVVIVEVMASHRLNTLNGLLQFGRRSF